MCAAIVGSWRACGGLAPVELAAPGAARPAAVVSAAGSPAAGSLALRLCGSNTIGAELAPALIDAFLHRKGAEAIARELAPGRVRLTGRRSGAPITIDIRATGSATAFTGLETAARLPTAFTITNEGYILSRRLYLYLPLRPRTPLATELIAFALSPQGQAVVRDTGFVDLDVTLREPERCDSRCPPGYAALTAGARRLSLDFRFRFGRDELDTRAARDLDRVVQFLRGYPDAKLRLLGFSDGAASPDTNLALSRQRAATLAHELALRGVPVANIEGMGAAMPVAPNTTESDRQRNRRVEVWLEGVP